MKCFLVFLILTNFCYAQEKLLKGQIFSNSKDLSEIAIYNLTQKTSAISNVSGEFEIKAELGDLLTFQALHLDYWRQSVKSNDIEQGMITVKMTEKTTVLDEIIIVDYPKLNAQDLGIINYIPKKYTPAQRKLRPATYTKQDIIDFLTFKSPGLPIDPILYWITGQTKKLKTNLKIEEKQLFIEEIFSIFEEEYFTDDLKIEPDYVRAFVFYVSEDEEFRKVFKTKDMTVIKWQLANLSTEFKTMFYEE